MPESEIKPNTPNKITPGRRMREGAAAAASGFRAPTGGAAGTGAPGAAGAPRGAGSGTSGSRGGDFRTPGGRGGRSGGRGGENRERVKPEFDSKIIDIRRVTRVTSGGRRMQFSVAVVVGDKKGRVGVGLGKGIDTALAVEKATREAKKHLIRVPLGDKGNIPHAVEGKLGSARIKIFPARGSGIVAGSSARAVIELAGIKDVCAKILSGSKNRLANARVAIVALENLVTMPRKSLKPTKK